MALANALTNGNRSMAGTLATLCDEHRLFLLAELVLSVAHASRRLLKRADKKSRKWLKELVGEAIGTLAEQVSSRQRLLEATLSQNLSAYVAAALQESSKLITPRTSEAANAG